MLSMTINEEDLRLRRREQVRLAQRRRRARLADGARTQVNLFLLPAAIARLEALSLLWGVERQEVVERLLNEVRIEASLPQP